MKEGIFLETRPFHFVSRRFHVRRENARRMDDDDDDDDDDDSQFFTSLNVRFSKHVFEALRFVLCCAARNRRKYDARARSIPTDRILSSPFFIVLGKSVKK